MARRKTPVHAAGLFKLDGLLCFCSAVRQHDRDRLSRNKFLAMAFVPVCLYGYPGVLGGPCGVSGRAALGLCVKILYLSPIVYFIDQVNFSSKLISDSCIGPHTIQ